MIVQWTIVALVFVAVALAVQTAWSLMYQSRRVNYQINRRLLSSKVFGRTSDVPAALRIDPGFFGANHPAARWLTELLMQTGLPVKPKLMMVGFLATTIMFFLVWSLIISQRSAVLIASVLSSLVSMLAFFQTARRQRMTRFGELLPDGLDVIVRAVRVGYPLPMALRLVARELPPPLGAEFGLTSEEISFGQDVQTAVENLYRRVGQEDLLFFAVAINVQYQTGGNLAEILSRLSRLIRARSKLRARIRTLSAEGRASAVILSLMPFILFGGISLLSPAYFGEIRNHALVVPSLIYGATSLLVGNIIMYRMVNFKF
jgi:tight adherence protein B